MGMIWEFERNSDQQVISLFLIVPVTFILAFDKTTLIKKEASVGCVQMNL